MGDPVGRWDFEVIKGATFHKLLTWRDSANELVDLTGYTARLQARYTPVGVAVLLELDTTPEDPGTGQITLGGDEGTITLDMTPEQTGALDFGQGVHDLILIDSAGGIRRLLEGTVQLRPEVTRV